MFPPLHRSTASQPTCSFAHDGSQHGASLRTSHRNLQRPKPPTPVTPGSSRINIELAGGILDMDGKTVATEIHGEMVLYDFDRLEGKLLAKALGGESDNLTVRGNRVFSTNSGSWN